MSEMAWLQQSRRLCEHPYARLSHMSDSVDPWREYRKRRNLVLFAFLGYVPVVFVIALVTIRLFHTTIPSYVAAFAWMAFYAIAGIRFQTFRCPRCGKWFFFRWWPPPHKFGRRCENCGLPKYAPLTSEHSDVRLQQH